ncbi:MAG TPA: cobaltochelatase subunit CobN [Spirochaetota bacterium]|nr:cobaltochelatase subunit CobN [Spirochaetota bacterium]
MRLTVIAWDIYSSMIARAAGEIGGVDLNLFSSKNVDSSPETYEKAVESLEKADLILLYRTGESFWNELDARFAELAQRKPLVCLASDPSQWGMSSVSVDRVSLCYAYLVYGGIDNFTNLLRYLMHVCDPSHELPPAPDPLPWQGIYHPVAEKCFTDTESFLDWYPHADRPLAGILFTRSYWTNDNCEMIDALVSNLEALGLGCMPVFTSSMSDQPEDRQKDRAAEKLNPVDTFFFDQQGNPILQALIKMTLLYTTPESLENAEHKSYAESRAAIFSRLNVPVFQPVISSYKTESEWKDDPHGLGSLTSWYVTLPEFEGVIEPIILAAASRSGEAGNEYRVQKPVEERARKISQRVKKWVDLRNKPAGERRIAFVLHNKPCASVEATVGGAAHLDSLESVARILQSMAGAGYGVSCPESGQELASMITGRKAVSEFRWTTVNEIIQKGGCLKQMPVDEYCAWFDGLSDSFKERITGVWGNPPGEEIDGVPPAMVHEGNIVITGIDFGGALVCVQPKRGCAGARCDGKVCKILHDPDLPPPHQYFATYRFIENDFGADAIVHVGTHGNLEFLPGKGVALSGDCCPDLAIGSMPHLYIYNADNPPEGAIAKRRSYATLVDHMQAVMTRSGLSDELEELDRLLGEYQSAKSVNRSRAHQLEHLVMDLVHKTNLVNEIKLSEEMSFDEVVLKAHEALSLVRYSQMNLGMHVFDDIPADDRRYDYIRGIMRGLNHDGFSLRKSLCVALGIDLDHALKNQGLHCGMLNMPYGTALDLCDDLALDFIRRTLSAKKQHPVETARDVLGNLLASEAGLDDFILHGSIINDIDRRIENSREMDALFSGFNGNYIPAGPSGKVTRGRYEIMPTGRNFYTLDIHTLPTKAAYRVGTMLAESLIEKHLAENGSLPENVAHYWTCMDITCADGEGMAQIMNLVGARPVWSSGGRVTGFEIIPLKELGRPRIDVTIRVGGINRDTFPECVSYLDSVIREIAALDEPAELNFLRKHSLERSKEKTSESDQAWDEAATRIFGSKPGTYMAGVNLAVYASAWKEEQDLADVFIYWNQYAYGSKFFGKEAAEDLVGSLKTVDVTFNKTYTDEYDLFGCCCYFATHGGMTAAARSVSGKDVKAYYGDTRDTENVGVRDLADEVRRVVRTKLLNPKWIEGMKSHGYKGLGDISKIIGRVYGWEATTRAVDDWIFDDITRAFVLDEEMKRAFEEHNPWALEEIGRRLLEAEQRGLWQADPEVLQGLKNSYLEVESWLEERMGDVQGEFQGGSVDIITPEEAAQWHEKIHSLRQGLRGNK